MSSKPLTEAQINFYRALYKNNPDKIPEAAREGYVDPGKEEKKALSKDEFMKALSERTGYVTDEFGRRYKPDPETSAARKVMQFGKEAASTAGTVAAGKALGIGPATAFLAPQLAQAGTAAAIEATAPFKAKHATFLEPEVNGQINPFMADEDYANYTLKHLEDSGNKNALMTPEERKSLVEGAPKFAKEFADQVRSVPLSIGAIADMAAPDFFKPRTPGEKLAGFAGEFAGFGLNKSIAAAANGMGAFGKEGSKLIAKTVAAAGIKEGSHNFMRSIGVSEEVADPLSSLIGFVGPEIGEAGVKGALNKAKNWWSDRKFLADAIRDSEKTAAGFASEDLAKMERKSTFDIGEDIRDAKKAFDAAAKAEEGAMFNPLREEASQAFVSPSEAFRQKLRKNIRELPHEIGGGAEEAKVIAESKKLLRKLGSGEPISANEMWDMKTKIQKLTKYEFDIKGRPEYPVIQGLVEDLDAEIKAAMPKEWVDKYEPAKKAFSERARATKELNELMGKDADTIAKKFERGDTLEKFRALAEKYPEVKTMLDDVTDQLVFKRIIPEGTEFTKPARGAFESTVKHLRGPRTGGGLTKLRDNLLKKENQRFIKSLKGEAEFNKIKTSLDRAAKLEKDLHGSAKEILKAWRGKDPGMLTKMRAHYLDTAIKLYLYKKVLAKLGLAGLTKVVAMATPEASPSTPETP